MSKKDYGEFALQAIRFFNAILNTAAHWGHHLMSLYKTNVKFHV